MEAAVVVVIVLVIGGLSMMWHFSRGRTVLERWAAENGYEILQSRYRHLLKGPFFVRSGKGHAVYHVTIRDRGGAVRTAYVRCGSWLGGLLSDHVVVEWMD